MKFTPAAHNRFLFRHARGQVANSIYIRSIAPDIAEIAADVQAVGIYIQASAAGSRETGIYIREIASDW